MRLTTLLALLIVLLTPATDARAQAPAPATDPAQLLLPQGPAREPSDDMRALIQDISAFARRAKPGFSVLVENGLSLLAKTDIDDETKLIPFRTFMRAVDGIVEDGFFYRDGPPRDEDRQARLEALAKVARNNRLSLFSVEYPAPKDAGAAINTAIKAGARPMIAPNPELNRLPTQPRRPLGENGNSVQVLSEVNNFAMLRDTWGFGSESDFVQEMRKTNYDMLVVDVYHGRKPLSREAVEGLKYKKLGARRLVLATMDVGRAETFRYYWQPGWREGNPPFIKETLPGQTDLYYVEYWQPAWKQIMTGTPQSYIYGLIAQGFDGVVLRGTDAYKYFDGTLQDEEGEAR